MNEKTITKTGINYDLLCQILNFDDVETLEIGNEMNSVMRNNVCHETIMLNIYLASILTATGNNECILNSVTVYVIITISIYVIDSSRIFTVVLIYRGKFAILLSTTCNLLCSRNVELFCFTRYISIYFATYSYDRHNCKF